MDEPRPVDGVRPLARAFWWLGFLALIGAAVSAVLLWPARAPEGLWPWPAPGFFRAARVVHANLAATMWPLALAATMWTLLGSTRWLAMGWAGIAGMGAGAALLAATPFLPGVAGVHAGYVPVADHGAFRLATALVAGGFLLVALRALATVRPRPWLGDPLRLGAWLAALAGAMAMAAFGWSWLRIPVIEERIYFDVLYWGGGHVLQFQHALLAAVAWAWVGAAAGAHAAATPRARSAMFVVAALPLLGVPVIYLGADAGTLVHMEAFARLMVWGHAYMLPLVVVALVAAWRLRGRWTEPAVAAMIVSLGLFGAGGAVGYAVGGGTAVLVAHAHAMGAAVSLAFMGLAFVLLPRLGYAAACGGAAAAAPWLFGGGQVLLATGLAWAGHHGLSRKADDVAQALSGSAQAAGVGLAALGGALALAGLALFFAAALRAMEPTPAAAAPSSGPRS